ncbi:MAG: T9SS type A sorting domain-containing protein [Chitinophagaceae bacterium]
MKKVIALIIIQYSLFIIHCAGQEYKRANNWLTGYSGNRVDFNSSNIITTQGLSPLKYFTGGNSCISDTAGSLVLSSDGYNIYGVNGQFIEGGDTLIPLDFYLHDYGWSAYSQGSIILPLDSNLYYHVVPTFSNMQFNDCISNNNCHFDLLLYNVIDMNANGGLGKVTKRMVPLMENANLRKTQMMACRHGNGKDWWLLKNEGDNADVHTFLFTQDSVYDKGVQTFAQPNWGVWDLRGQSAFSADGAMFATTSHCSSCGLIFIADFDRCYGLLSNPRTIQLPWNSQHNPNDTTWMERLSTGLAFSPNGNFLYISSGWNIYQYDLIDDTLLHITGLDSTAFAQYETMYNAPDGKIYIGNFHGVTKQMSRIDNPDVKGAGCNFCPRCLRLDSVGANAYVGTPPCMPNYGLGARTCWPLSISQYDNEPMSKLVVYPNPTNSKLLIKNGELKMKELYNSVGQLILSTKENEIGVSNLPKGMYYLRCGNQVKKVVVE